MVTIGPNNQSNDQVDVDSIHYNRSMVDNRWLIPSRCDQLTEQLCEESASRHPRSIGGKDPSCLSTALNSRKWDRSHRLRAHSSIWWIDRSVADHVHDHHREHSIGREGVVWADCEEQERRDPTNGISDTLFDSCALVLRTHSGERRDQRRCALVEHVVRNWRRKTVWEISANVLYDLPIDHGDEKIQSVHLCFFVGDRLLGTGEIVFQCHSGVFVELSSRNK